MGVSSNRPGVLAIVVAALTGCNASVVRVADPDRVAERDAIVIVPGIGVTSDARLAMEKFFAKRGHDLFIPDYIARDGLEECAENLRTFFDEVGILSYRKVHVFTYIMGTWVFNLLLDEYPFPNLASVVCGRSPIQERIPAVAVEELGFFVDLLYGDVVEIMSRTPYPPFPRRPEHPVKLGLIIENRASPMAEKYRDKVLAPGPLSWDVSDLGETPDDQLYVWLDHTEMYYRFDVTGPEILHFFEHGRFSPTAQRVPIARDVLEANR